MTYPKIQVKIHFHFKQQQIMRSSAQHSPNKKKFLKKERREEKTKRMNINKMKQMNNLKCESQSMYPNAKGTKALENE